MRYLLYFGYTLSFNIAFNDSRLCEAVDFEKQMFNLK